MCKSMMAAGAVAAVTAKRGYSREVHACSNPQPWDDCKGERGERSNHPAHDGLSQRDDEELLRKGLEENTLNSLFLAPLTPSRLKSSQGIDRLRPRTRAALSRRLLVW